MGICLENKVADEGCRLQRKALFLLIEEKAQVREERRFLSMPVLQTEDEIVPRSIIRHRPIKNSTPPGVRRSVTTAANNPTVQRASRARPAAPDTLDDIAEWRQEEARVDTR